MVKIYYYDTDTNHSWWGGLHSNGYQPVSIDSSDLKGLFCKKNVDFIHNLKDGHKYMFIIHTGESLFRGTSKDSNMSRWRKTWDSFYKEYADKICVLFVSGGSFLIHEKDVPNESHYFYKNIPLAPDNKAKVLNAFMNLITNWEATGMILFDILSNAKLITHGWQNRRSRFNHDWMKNEYITRDLGAWMNLLNGRIRNPKIEESFVGTVLPAWQSHQDEAKALLIDFEAQMSPRTLFSELPLVNCNEETKQWLGELIHHLWLERYSIKKLVADAKQSAQKTNEVYAKLQNALIECKDTKKIEALRPFTDIFAEFLDNCRALSEAIEKFPSEVKAA